MNIIDGYTRDLHELARRLVDETNKLADQLEADDLAVIADPTILPMLQIRTTAAVASGLAAIAFLIDRVKPQETE